MPPISENTRFSFKASAYGVGVCFIIVCTWNVSKFMSSVQAFQDGTVTRLAALEASMKSAADANTALRDAQRDVYDDRWRASDMTEWAHRFEGLNREVNRENGSHGLLVPEPLPAPKRR